MISGVKPDFMNRLGGVGRDPMAKSDGSQSTRSFSETLGEARGGAAPKSDFNTANARTTKSDGSDRATEKSDKSEKLDRSDSSEKSEKEFRSVPSRLKRSSERSSRSVSPKALSSAGDGRIESEWLAPQSARIEPKAQEFSGDVDGIDEIDGVESDINTEIEKAPNAVNNADVGSEIGKSRPRDEASNPQLIIENARAGQIQVRRQAMQDFLTQMQSEFGIAPEKVVEAFSRMDEATLKRPADESTKAFLTNLDLPVKQQARAGELYQAMVDKTGSAALNEKLIGAEAGLKLDVVSPRDEALRSLNKAIDQLNDAFALRNPVQPQASGDLMRAQIAADQMNAQLLKIERPNAQSVMNGERRDDNDDGMAGGAAFDLVGGSGGALAAAAAGLAASQGGLEDGLGAGDQSDFKSGKQDQWSNASVETAAQPKEMKSQFGEMVKPQAPAKKVSVASEAAASEKGELKATEQSVNPAGQPTKFPTAANGTSGMMLERPVPTAQDEKENVKELIRQAQLALKKGGGEIKMDLKPEGMGQVRMKVSVEDGQVNLQMLTENDAAKRLLEKGLSELKSDLAAHHLKLDDMKVNVGQELQKHMSDSGDQAREQTRQFASDFMSQMRDERQGFRQGFMENRGWRQYPRGGADLDAESGRNSSVAGASASSSAGARYRAGRSATSRLDLVA